MKLEQILPHLFEAAYIVDNNRKILFWNEKCEKITGYTAEEVVGKYCYNNILRHVTDSGDPMCHGNCPLKKCIENQETNTRKLFLHHKEGYRIPVTIKTIPFYDVEDGQFKGIELFTDMLDEKEYYKQNKSLTKETITDNLTNIYNRKFIDYQLDTSIREFDIFNTPLSILFIDIDHFKKVNDTYGHDIGDLVLKNVTKTMSKNVGIKDFVGRYGGEEFIIVLRNSTKQQMIETAEKIRALIETTDIAIDDAFLNVTVSIGCSNFRKGLTKELFVKEADEFMYRAKASGRNKVLYK